LKEVAGTNEINISGISPGQYYVAVKFKKEILLYGKLIKL